MGVELVTLAVTVNTSGTGPQPVLLVQVLPDGTVLESVVYQ